jgi:hypothetical protein
MTTCRPTDFERDKAARDFYSQTKISVKDDPVLSSLLHSDYLDNPSLLTTPGCDTSRDKIATAFRRYAERIGMKKALWSRKERAVILQLLADTSRGLIAFVRPPSPHYARTRRAVAHFWSDVLANTRLFATQYKEMCGTTPRWLSQNATVEDLHGTMLWVALTLRIVLGDISKYAPPKHRPPNWALRSLLTELSEVGGERTRLTHDQVALLCFAAGVQPRSTRCPTRSSMRAAVNQLYKGMAQWEARERERRAAQLRAEEQLRRLGTCDSAADLDPFRPVPADLSLFPQRRT